jgi:cyanophycinase
MTLPLQPIYLLADSQLLFWHGREELFLNTVRSQIDKPFPKAAYIGASNGDLPEFYDIFKAAMAGINISDCRMVRSDLSTEDFAFLEESDIILLAGGDPVEGWKIFERNGLKDLLVRRYYEGTLLIGVSAGAVQLGLMTWPEGAGASSNFTETFKLVPFIISAHDEKGDWAALKNAVQSTGGSFHGLGLPTGGGAIYYADHSLEPIRYALYEFSYNENASIVSSALHVPNPDT